MRIRKVSMTIDFLFKNAAGKEIRAPGVEFTGRNYAAIKRAVARYRRGWEKNGWNLAECTLKKGGDADLLL